MGSAPDFCDIHASGQKPLQVSAFRAGVEPFERRKWGSEAAYFRSDDERPLSQFGSCTPTVGSRPQIGQSINADVRC